MVLKIFKKMFSKKDPQQLSYKEYLQYCEDQRRDDAARAWKANRDMYQPKFEVSLDPVCPYCLKSLGERKPPTRRSKFSCKSCGLVVMVDPHHKIFPSVYLNEMQALIARSLSDLDKVVFAAGKTEDFWWAVQQKDWTKGKELLSENEVADMLWFLLNYSMIHMDKILPPGEANLRPEYSKQLQTMQEGFRKEEKEIKNKEGKVTSGKLSLICPFCTEDLGEVVQPSKRSKRKCKKCKATIYVDPHQKLFETPFITESQQYLANALDQLAHWVFTMGGIDAFNKTKRDMNIEGEVTEKQIAEIIEKLIAHNLEKVRLDSEKQAQEYRKLFDDNSIEPDIVFTSMVEELSSKFEDFLKENYQNVEE